MDVRPDVVRRFWEAIEPLHAVVYFAPSVADAAAAVGLRGWWMGYFAGRAAPLGAVGPAPVTSMFYGFAPSMVARALPDAWSFASPADVLRTRMAAVSSALRHALLSPSDDVAELAHLLWRAVAACDFAGRPLAAAWADVPAPADAHTALWLAVTILREHRGDGHVLSAVHAGLTGLEATVTLVGTGAISRSSVQPHRGWADDQWQSAVDVLTTRGLLNASARLTAHGFALRRDIETATDRLATAPVAALGAEADRAIALAIPLSRHLVDTGAVPVPNPMGAPRP